MRQFLKVVLVNMALLAAGLVALEWTLRIFDPLPVFGGAFLDKSGALARIAKDDVLLYPNLEVVHTGSEFTAPVHTNGLGYRRTANERLDPDYLFVGDSFTFGHGVDDDHTFASVFCRDTGSTCLNLGRSGTDTFEQANILAAALERHAIRPRAVVVVMLAACWIGSSGNDLGGNLANHANRGSPKDGSAQAETGWVRRVQSMLTRLELTKRALLILSNPLKASLYDCSDDALIDRAVEATTVAWGEFIRLSRDHGFSLWLVAIHPSQELAGAYRQTERHLAAAIPGDIRPIFTAGEFRKEHYFPYDGHFNAAGHANLAAILARSLKAGRGS